jgi:hypothetical protein
MLKPLNRRMFAAAVAIWMACGAVMGVAQSATTKDNALIIHLIATPIIVLVVSLAYFTRTGSNRVALTAAVFTAVPMTLDFLLVAVVLLRSLEMFGSLIGTWIPFALIFTVTYLSGRLVAARGSRSAAAPATS